VHAQDPGVEMSTGSLGHGTSVALGMALAARLQGRSYWTYVLIGEGDLNEGQTWEAIMAAAKFRPPRLVALIDCNKVQLDGPATPSCPWTLCPRNSALSTGMSLRLCMTATTPPRCSRPWIGLSARLSFPAAVIYKTHKGRGVSFMEDNAHWHGAVVDDQTYAKARAELVETLGKLEAAL